MRLLKQEQWSLRCRSFTSASYLVFRTIYVYVKVIKVLKRLHSMSTICRFNGYFHISSRQWFWSVLVRFPFTQKCGGCKKWRVGAPQLWIDPSGSSTVVYMQLANGSSASRLLWAPDVDSSDITRGRVHTVFSGATKRLYEILTTLWKFLQWQFSFVVFRRAAGLCARLCFISCSCKKSSWV